MKLLLIVLILPMLFGFKFNPMSQTIELGENQKTAQFLIENESSESMAIDLSVLTRTMDENGKEDLIKAEELSVYPPQMIIPSKEKRTIRVTYKGDQNISTEKSFRVVAEQLPLSVDSKTKKKSGIQMLMRYMAALYVNPKDSKSDLSGSISKSTSSKLSLKISNNGNRHVILLKPVITISQGKKTWSFKGGTIKTLDGENVLAKSSRTFEIMTKEKIPADSKVSIKVDEN